ncbi:helix-turn-helix transcriptional regulator [Pontibacter sp. G13]|uniref:helix-turn-helix domain-containing protein n=1 Tax=Pontibacter sp. G13 TaxID=3074898 RepID=UPI00288AD663|nr:helix-turn-helix transcriptional regulator [Pontibacter sp. G13]WNJ20342.1 helix-turn-helix transcriptional regulator [Pontibacter sp. G13]
MCIFLLALTRMPVAYPHGPTSVRVYHCLYSSKPEHTPLEFLLHIGIAQSLFGAFLFLTKSDKRTSDYLLSIWLGLMGLFMGMSLLKMLHPASFWARRQLFPFFFAMGPFFILYIRSVIASGPALHPRSLVQFVPFIGYSLLAIAQPNYRVDEAVLSGQVLAGDFWIITLPALGSMIGYTIWSWNLIRNHQRQLPDHFSFESEQLTLTWLRVVSLIFTATFSMTMISSLANVSSVIQINPGWFLFSGLAFFAYAIMYYGMKQPAIFDQTRDRTEWMPPSDLADSSKPDAPEHSQGKYARSGLTDDRALRYLELLRAFMEDQKGFQQRDLTIADVAEKLGVSKHHLTQAINEHWGKNFYQVVNGYRVEYVKQLLEDPSFDKYTLLSVAHEAGFNSKSAFNLTFKKFVGMTPSAYRLMIREP